MTLYLDLVYINSSDLYFLRNLMSLYSVWVGVGGVSGGYGGGLVFKILIVLHIFFWRGLIYGSLLTEFYGISSSYFLEHFSMASSDYTHVMIWGGIGRVFF